VSKPKGSRNSRGHFHSKVVKNRRNYVANKRDLGFIQDDKLTKKDKDLIDRAVKRTIAEYGEALRLLGTK
jgi:hypothetical protein